MINYRFLEEGFKELLTLVEPIFSQVEIAEVQHFVDVGEYGLALETFCGVVVSGKKMVTSSVLQKCFALAEEMDMQDDIQAMLKDHHG